MGNFPMIKNNETVNWLYTSSQSEEFNSFLKFQKVIPVRWW